MRSYRCCQHNVAIGWPYFAEHLWMATAGNGLAAVLYAPARVKAKVGDGVSVDLEIQTAYPFDDTIDITVRPASATRFPLSLRIPAWAKAPAIEINRWPCRCRPACARGSRSPASGGRRPRRA